MQFTRLPKGAVERIAREGYAKHFPDGPPKARPPENGRAMLLLTGADTVEIPYKGTLYELLHISFEDGLVCVIAKAAIEGLEGESITPETVDAYRAAMRSVVALVPRYLRPVRGRLRRLRWRLGLHRNPFRRATDAEVGQLLGFFLGCRMRSRVHSRPPSNKDSPRRATF